MKEEKFPHTKVSQSRSGREILGTSEGSKTGSQKEKWRKFTTEIKPNSTSQLRSGLHTHDHTLMTTIWESEGWMLRLGFWGLDLRESISLDCCEDTLQGLE